MINFSHAKTGIAFWLQKNTTVASEFGVWWVLSSLLAAAVAGGFANLLVVPLGVTASLLLASLILPRLALAVKRRFRAVWINRVYASSSRQTIPNVILASHTIAPLAYVCSSCRRTDLRHCLLKPKHSASHQKLSLANVPKGRCRVAGGQMNATLNTNLDDISSRSDEFGDLNCILKLYFQPALQSRISPRPTSLLWLVFIALLIPTPPSANRLICPRSVDEVLAGEIRIPADKCDCPIRLPLKCCKSCLVGDRCLGRGRSRDNIASCCCRCCCCRC